jgi:hypothetical protein
MSGSKRQNVKRADLPTPVTGGAGQPLATAATTPEQPRPTAPAPFGLKLLTSGYERSGPSPSAYAQLDWFAAPGTPASATWELEWSRAADFSQTPIKKTTTKPGEIRGLVPGVTYVRVRAVISGLPGLWSPSLAVTISPLSDAPPPVPMGLTAIWSPITGNLEMRCVRPAGEQVAGIRFRIYTAAGGTLLRTVDDAGGQYVWEREQQRADRGGALVLPAAASCYLLVNAVSWAGNLSADVTLAVTLTAPAAVTGLTTSWAGDTGTAGPTCRTSFTGTAATPFYDITVDGVAQPAITGQTSGTLAYDYDLGRNAADHSGTPDPVLSISVRGRDALGQLGPAATITATNAAPPTTTLSVFSGRFLIALTIGASAAADIKDYQIRVYRNGGASPVKTFFVNSLKPTYTPEDGSGIYTFDIAARDLFNQVGTPSAQTVGVDLIDPTQFVADLRAGLIYSDSAGTAQSVLAGLKDGDLATNVITYGASAGWGSTTADWQEEITTQIAEISLSVACSVYLGYSIDGTTWTWAYGGTPAAGRWTPTSTTTTEATAQAGAVTLAAGNWRVRLATPRRARFIRLARRNTTLSYALREFFPATLVRATYVEAENLAAISADLGTVTAGNVIGVVITGSTIRTAETGARIQLSGSTLAAIDAAGATRVAITPDGLKTFDSLGNVQIEATTATDGALLAGAAKVKLDKIGLSFIAATTATIDTGMAKWYTAGGGLFGVIDMYAPAAAAAQGRIEVGDYGSALGSRLLLSANRASVSNAEIRLINQSGVRRIELGLDSIGLAPSFTLDLTGVFIGGTNLTVSGNVSGAQYSATGTSGARVGMTYDNTNDAGYLFAILDGVAYKPLRIQTVGGGVILGNAAGAIGLFGSSGTTKPTITGSRAGNAALASLLTALANMGAVTNSTTA